MTLETLEERFREAREAYAEDRTEENHDKYRKAKLKFTEARTDQKYLEEADPDHPRGQSVAVITDNDGGDQ